MALRTFIVEECRAKSSPDCTQTFKRERKRGRPQLDCNPCRAARTKAAPAIAKVMVHDCNSEGWECIVNNDVTDHHRKAEFTRSCPCGNTFIVKAGRGRKAEKCDSCRNAGTVYRLNDEGTVETIRAEALAEEQREIREQAGRDRAARLCELMAPLLLRDEKRRKLATAA